MLLRVLIGAACVAVIGFVGMAAWDRYGRNPTAAEQLLADCTMYERELQEAGKTRAQDALYASLMRNCPS